jgi:DNA polymerase I-like protein with 3'-5' exonuclease and polymerase domains
METYCKRDVDITEKLYTHFANHASDFSKRSVDLEHAVRRAINIQEDNGFYIDTKAANLLLCELSDESLKIEMEMQETFEPTILPRKRIPDKIVPFNPQSRQQIADRLMKRGWQPTEFTEKSGNPVVNEKTLGECELPEAKQLVRYMLLKKREAQINSWLKVVNPKTNRVHGRVITIGAVTNRMTHNSPNMAQVPAVYSPYGTECRSCWTVEDKENYRLVGADSSGLELRCLAHYIKDDDYTREILEGDIHTANQKMAGLPTRDNAKTFIYAFLYGAGAAKIGSIVGKDFEEGQKLIGSFLEKMPKLSKWRNEVMEEAEASNKVKALDGRYLHVRSSHSSVNTLLQGAGAIICKDWLTQIMSLVKVKGLDAKPVANVHDEVQFEVHLKDAEEFSKLTHQATKQTEESLSVNCPLDSEAKIGFNWAETH